MRIQRLLLARSVRLIEIQHRDRVYIPDLVEALRGRYAFVRYPQTADELTYPPEKARPLEFHHGKFVVHNDHTIVIISIQLHPKYVFVDTATSTDDSDMVMDDLLAQLPSVVQPSSPERIYANQVEVELSTDLEAAAPIAANLCSALTVLVRSYGAVEAPPFRVSGVMATIDPLEHALACDFRIERRANVPYQDNIYFAQAPLRTQDHVVLLDKFEQTMLLASLPIPTPPKTS